MGKTHTSLWFGWTITIWMDSAGIWLYIACKDTFYKRGEVKSSNRTQAIWAVIGEIK